MGFQHLVDTIKNTMQRSIERVVDILLAQRGLPVDLSLMSVRHTERLADVFLDIGRRTFSENSRLYKYMMHFVHGGGEPISFRIDDLIHEDKGARERILGEVTRRASGIPTVREKIPRPNYPHFPIILIHILHYSNQIIAPLIGGERLAH